MRNAKRRFCSLQTCLSQPQYLFPASYYCVSRDIRAHLEREALRACFGCGPSYNFLIGIPAPQSEVKKWKRARQEFPKHSQQTASLSFSYNFFIYFLSLFKSPVRACELSPRARLLDPTNFLSASCVLFFFLFFFATTADSCLSNS